jgi:hypothetical protein
LAPRQPKQSAWNSSDDETNDDGNEHAETENNSASDDDSGNQKGRKSATKSSNKQNYSSDEDNNSDDEDGWVRVQCQNFSCRKLIPSNETTNGLCKGERSHTQTRLRCIVTDLDSLPFPLAIMFMCVCVCVFFAEIGYSAACTASMKVADKNRSLRVKTKGVTRGLLCDRLYVVVHSIDNLTLSQSLSSPMLTLISLLASLDRVSIIASVNHVDAPLGEWE